MGNQRVGIFPPKSKILFVLSLALIWCRNFQDRTIPVAGDTWTSFWRKERRRRRRIQKYPRSGLFFRSNISETVWGIRVLFSLWPRAIVALPNGANDVSVAHIVSEIWSRQHQIFGMLTCTSERNQYPFELIRTANKEISAFLAVFRSNISETVWGIRVLFSLWPRAIVALPNGANDVSVVHIVSEIWSRQHQNFGMLTCTSERNQYPFEWIRTANKEISRSPFRAMCFRSNISETVRDNRVLFSLSSIAMIALPNSTYVVFIVVIVSEI